MLLSIVLNSISIYRYKLKLKLIHVITTCSTIDSHGTGFSTKNYYSKLIIQYTFNFPARFPRTLNATAGGDPGPDRRPRGLGAFTRN